VPRFLALQAEWRRRPPTRWLVAAALKYQSPAAASARTAPTINDLKSMFADGAG